MEIQIIVTAGAISVVLIVAILAFVVARLTRVQRYVSIRSVRTE